VLSTLHTNDAPSAVMRLLELGVPYYLLEATLIGIMAQRLVRTLCPDCKKPDGELNDDVWNGLSEGWTLPRPKTVYRPVGCPECRQTGYRGRTGLYELLTITQPFSKLIKEATDIHALRHQRRHEAAAHRRRAEDRRRRHHCRRGAEGDIGIKLISAM
jgi:general secretion pathway protein E